MDDLKIELHITPPLGEKQIIPLECCIIGGTMGDGSGTGIGAFLGSLGLEKSTIAMTHVTRAFVKTMEQNIEKMIEMKLMPSGGERVKNLSIIRELAIKIVNEAFQREIKNDPLDNVDLDTHSVKMRWDNRGPAKG